MVKNCERYRRVLEHSFRDTHEAVVADVNDDGLQYLHDFGSICLRGRTQFFGNFFICGPIRTKFAQNM